MKIRTTITLFLFLLLIIYTDRSAFTYGLKVSPPDLRSRCSPPSCQQPVDPSPHSECDINTPAIGSAVYRAALCFTLSAFQGNTLSTDIFGRPE